MANVKISALPATSTPALVDLLAKVNNPSGTPVTQRVTVQQYADVIAAYYRLNPVDGILMDSTNGNSVDFGTQRALIDSGGYNTVHWNAKTLGDGTIISVDWGNRFLKDTSGNNSVHWQDRTLKDSSGNEAVHWQDRILRSNNGATSADWQERNLWDNASNVSVEWQERQLWDSASRLSVKWHDRILSDSSVSSITSVDWGFRVLTDENDAVAANWNNRQLVTSDDIQVLNWSTQAAAIADAEPDLPSIRDTLNTLLATLRTYGLIAT